MCWAAGRWRSSTIAARSTTICSACCRAWCRPTSRRAIPNDKTGQINTVLGKNPLLFDRYLSDAIEIDVDALSDGKTVVVAGIMEHIEEAGIHSGDSACSLPPHSLEPETIAELERADARSWRCALEVGGLMNVQYAHQGRRHLRARGQSARLAHGAVRRQGDRHAGRQDRGARHGGRAACIASTSSFAGSTMSGSRRRCFRSPASPASTPCWGRRCDRPARSWASTARSRSPSPRASSAAGSRPPTVGHRVRLGHGRRQGADRRAVADAAGARLQDPGHLAEPSATSPPHGLKAEKVNKVSEGRPHAADAMQRRRAADVQHHRGGDLARRFKPLAPRRPLAKDALLHHTFRRHRGGRRASRAVAAANSKSGRCRTILA